MERLIARSFDPGLRNSSASALRESDQSCCPSREGDRLRFHLAFGGSLACSSPSDLRCLFRVAFCDGTTKAIDTLVIRATSLLLSTQEVPPGSVVPVNAAARAEVWPGNPDLTWHYFSLSAANAKHCAI